MSHPDDLVTPRVMYDGRRFLLWKPRQIYSLRCVYRIVGALVGALPTNKRQDVEHGAPLSLLHEEALLAVEEGIVEVVDVRELIAASETSGATTADAPADSSDEAPAAHGFHEIHTECPGWAELPLPALDPEQMRAIVAGAGRLPHAMAFRALWERGLYITPALAFGADYLCYRGDPMRHHAHLLVHVSRPGRALRPVELACAARLAGSVKKAAVLAECSDEGGRVRFIEVDTATACLSHAQKRAAEEGRWLPERRPVARSWGLVESKGGHERRTGNKKQRPPRAQRRAFGEILGSKRQKHI